MEAAQGDTTSAPDGRMSRAEATADYLVFEVEDGRYALPIGDVHEVLPALEVDHLPGDSGTLLGVMTLRGRMVPVVDLRRHLGESERPVRPQDHFLVAEWAGRHLVLPCDQVLGIQTLSREEDEETLTLVRGRGRIAWVVRDAQGLILVPDLTAAMPVEDAA